MHEAQRYAEIHPLDMAAHRKSGSVSNNMVKMGIH